MAKSIGLEKIKLFPQKALQRVADKHVTIFRKRVRGGDDARGNTFKSYKSKYAEKKARKMTKLKGGRYAQYKGIAISSAKTAPPDFTLRGLTLKNLKRITVEGDSYTIGFRGEAADIVKGNEEKGRDIYTGIPQAELNQVTNLINKELGLEIKKKLKPHVKITVG